jgi:hypothetical protein
MFSTHKLAGLTCGPPSLLSNGSRDSASGVKFTGHNADHSFPANAEFKNEWRYKSAPAERLYGLHRQNRPFSTVKGCTLRTTLLFILNLCLLVPQHVSANSYAIIRGYYYKLLKMCIKWRLNSFTIL